MRQVTTRILGTALATLVLIAGAYATSVDFLPGNHPQSGEQNILFNTTMMGFTVIGHTNNTDTMVDYTSSTDLSAKGGQSDIDAENGGLVHDITITIAKGNAFKDLIINPFKDAVANNIVVDVFLTNGQQVMDDFDNSTHGDQFLTIVATGSALINKVTITSTGGFQSLDQTRISGISEVTIVPEPSSLLLLGSGLLGFAPMLRRKKLS
jgi:hypothetical protein